LTSDHAPEAIPDIIAACSRGKLNRPTLSAVIWNPPPMKHAQDMSAIAAGTEANIGATPSASDETVSSPNRPTGRGLVAATRSAIHPQKK
jgi:hypothetical protein